MYCNSNSAQKETIAVVQNTNDKIFNEFSELFKGADKLEELVNKDKEMDDMTKQSDLNSKINNKKVSLKC